MTRMRGAIPTPRHRLAAAQPHLMSAAVLPSSFIRLPRTLLDWLNFVNGTCVTAEEAFNKACSGILISNATVKEWATAHGVMDGAYLDSVLEWMAQKGFNQDGNFYNDGGKASVDWTNDAVLKDAIYAAPVKIGVAAGQLENVVGAKNGWFGLNFHRDQNIDHCISLCGYGAIGQLAQWLGVSLPAGVDGTRPGYAAFTWATVGILDVPSMNAITGEAWSRTPPTITVGSNPPAPDVVFTPNVPIPPPPPPPPPPPASASILLSHNVLAGQWVQFKSAKPKGLYVFQSPSGATAE